MRGALAYMRFDTSMCVCVCVRTVNSVRQLKALVTLVNVRRRRSIIRAENAAWSIVTTRVIFNDFAWDICILYYIYCSDCTPILHRIRLYYVRYNTPTELAYFGLWITLYDGVSWAWIRKSIAVKKPIDIIMGDKNLHSKNHNNNWLIVITRSWCRYVRLIGVNIGLDCKVTCIVAGDSYIDSVERVFSSNFYHAVP